MHIRLSKLNVEGVQNMIRQVEDLKSETDKLDAVFRTHAINGRVLAHCDLMELKSVKKFFAHNRPEICELKFGNF